MLSDDFSRVLANKRQKPGDIDKVGETAFGSCWRELRVNESSIIWRFSLRILIGSLSGLARTVHRVDSVIRWISCYPVH